MKSVGVNQGVVGFTLENFETVGAVEVAWTLKFVQLWTILVAN